MKKIIIFLSLLLALTGCGNQNTENTKPKVFASFHVMESMVKEIGADKVEITNLTQNGEVHDFEISASQMAALCDGDLFVYCGGADHWAEDIAQTVQNEGCEVLETSQGIATNNHDFHIWLDPDMAMEQMEKICESLSQISPQNKDFFEENLAQAKDKYLTLKNNMKLLTPKSEGKTIVVSHGAYGYLCEELGLEQLSIEGVHGESDPTASQMAEVIDFAKENNIKYIFTSPQEASKPAQTVAAETNAEILTLDSMECDNGNGGYFEVMDYNLQQISKAIGE